VKARFLATFVVVIGVMGALPAFAQSPVLPAVSIVSESPGWFDVVLPILGKSPVIEEGKQRGIALLIGGVLNGENISIALGIPDEWEEANLKPPPPFKSYASLLVFERVGKSSDRFMRALSTVYLQPNRDLLARDRVEVDAISLANDPRPIGSTPLNAKVFVRGEKEEDYGEFYLNVDWKAGVVTIKEKDPEYRPAILKALSGGAR
jgi:hypothetical protein